MKLAQFTLKDSDQPRLGVLIGDVVCDVAELARAVRDAGGKTADWLLAVSSTLEVVRRGPTAINELGSLVNLHKSNTSTRGVVVGHRLDEINFLPAVNAGKILAIGRNYIDHAIDLRVQSASITFNGTCTFSGTGTGTMGGVSGPVNFTVSVTDNGEPGTSDTFQISVTGTFQYDSSLGHSLVLSGGNIQAHRLTCQ